MKESYLNMGLPTPVNLEEGEKECDWLYEHVGDSRSVMVYLWDDLLSLAEETHHGQLGKNFG